MAETLDRWRSVADNADLVRFVAGMFNRLAVHVSGRDEDLTVEHDGRRVRLIPGADAHCATSASRSTRPPPTAWPKRRPGRIWARPSDSGSSARCLPPPPRRR